MYYDSAGRSIREGNRVRFRGEVYTIKSFKPGEGRSGTAAIEFEEPEIHTEEVPDEWSVDLV